MGRKQAAMMSYSLVFEEDTVRTLGDVRDARNKDVLVTKLNDRPGYKGRLTFVRSSTNDKLVTVAWDKLLRLKVDLDRLQGRAPQASDDFQDVVSTVDRLLAEHRQEDSTAISALIKSEEALINQLPKLQRRVSSYTGRIYAATPSPQDATASKPRTPQR